jgi:peptidyl-prolyl cis-trans isomerase C
LLIAAAILIGFVTPCPGQPAQDRLALVNDVPITRQDVIQEAAVISADIELRNLMWTPEQISQLSNQILGTLVDRELLYQRARQRNIEIRSQWIERALMDLKSKIGNADAFDAYLKRTGLSEEQLRERIQKGLIVKRLLHREVIRQIKVSEAEMQAFFSRHPEFFIRKDQVRVRQIFVAFHRGDDVSARGEALLRIQSIQDRLRQGADFAALALEYSEDPSKARGGDLGYLERNQLIPAFAEAAFALQPGEISDIVESRIGYHLIKMVDRNPSSQMAYRNTRTKIERTLRRNKEKAAAADYLAKLKSQAKIIR